MKYRFASCCLDTARYVLERDGRILHVEPQVFDLLAVLARSAGGLVTHEMLVAEVWRGLAVSNATISSRINAARRAVGDDGRAQTIIETVARRGFRLAVPVDAQPVAPGPPDGVPHALAGTLPSLAVLPFRCLGDGAPEVLADGLAEEITAALSRVHEFRVIAQPSSLLLPQNRTAIPVAAQPPGADYLVGGSLVRSGQRMRIGVSLLDAEGQTLWTMRLDDQAEDPLDLQDRLARAVAGQLPVKLREAEIARALHGVPDSARACYLLALPHLWAPRHPSNVRALDLLSRALEMDDGYVRAAAYKAWALAQQSTYMCSEDAEADRAKALDAAAWAADRVDDDAPSLVAISAAYSMSAPDLEPALTFARRALEIDPNSAWGHLRLGWALAYDGQPAEALLAFETARQCSPQDPFLYSMRVGSAVAQADLGHHDEAVRTIREAQTHLPGITWVHRLLAGIYGQMGDIERARASARLLLEAHPGLTKERLLASLPPAVVRRNPNYLRGLEAAGLL